MSPTNAAYLAELARQFGFLSAFLGALSGAFVVQLLPLQRPERIVAACALAATAATVAFIVSVLGATLVVAATYPGAPAGLSSSRVVGGGGSLAALPFLAGVYLLLLTLALAGWIRSRRMGVATAGLALIGALFGGWTLIGF